MRFATRDRFAWRAAVCFWLVGGCDCGGGGMPATETDVGPPMEDAGEPDASEMLHIANPVLVQTMAPEQVRAGQLIPVTCTIIDDSGEIYPAEDRTLRLRVSPEASVERMDGELTAIRAGVVEVACSFPDLMLLDDTPSRVEILPGDPAEIVTSVDRSIVEAGESIEASCEVFDAYGNFIEDAEPTVVVEPSLDGNTTDELSTEFTTAGIYDVSCALAGAASVSERVEVQPTVPANLVAAKVPDQPVYGIGDVVTVATVVTDRYNNVIRDADVQFESVPPGDVLGRNRFRYGEDGTYVVTATVDLPTESGEPLTAQVTIIVNGNGPSIDCNGPVDGAMVDMAPGDPVTFTGTVADISGIDRVRVGGELVDVDESGNFSSDIETKFGINFVDIVATDTFGAESTRTCAFLVSDRWADPDALLDDAISLKLSAAAVDDGDRSGSLNSLADLLYLVLNSQGLVNTLDATLLGANPLYNACVQEACLPFVGCSCIFRLRLNYRGGSLTVGGPNTVTLQLVDGGLRAQVRVENIQMGASVGGTVSTNGTATLRSLAMDLTFDIGLRNGVPRVTVRSINSVNVGGVSTNFSGLAGFVVDIIVSLFEGTVRNLLRDQLRGFIETSFDEVLDGVVSGLDISSLGTSFAIPRLDGSGDIDLGFGVGFSHLNANPSRALFGIGSRFTGPVGIGTPTLGVAYPPGALRADPTLPPGTAAASIHVVLFNQVMHALWRAGLLEATIDGAAFGDSFPEGLRATISAALPPVAEIDEDQVDIGIGALALQLVYPGIFDVPISVVLGAQASTNVALNGNDLAFDAITIDELYFSTGDVSLDEETRNVLEMFLASLVQSLVDSLLNDSLPALPIPSFALPLSLSDYGIPAGTELGLVDPSLSNEPQHFVLRSDFGSL